MATTMVRVGRASLVTTMFCLRQRCAVHSQSMPSSAHDGKASPRLQQKAPVIARPPLSLTTPFTGASSTFTRHPTHRHAPTLDNTLSSRCIHLYFTHSLAKLPDTPLSSPSSAVLHQLPAVIATNSQMPALHGRPDEGHVWQTTI